MIPPLLTEFLCGLEMPLYPILIGNKLEDYLVKIYLTPYKMPTK